MRLIPVRTLVREDWPTVARMYGEGIATGDATFETAVPDWESCDGRYVKVPGLVAVHAGEGAALLGWAALSPVSARAGHAGVGEVSVYVAASARGRGAGQREGIWRDVILLERRSTRVGTRMGGSE